MHRLGDNFIPPAWDTLWLDSAAAMPHVGSALVLAMSALEVFISVTLDRLAAASSLPSEMWGWLNERPQRLSNPSTDEQFDTLLKVLTGHSLKDDEQQLWGSYRQPKNVRNSYVHEGVAVIGKDVVSLQKAGELITDVGKIIALIRGWMPESLRWPHPEVSTTFQFEIPFPGNLPSPQQDSE